MAYRHTLRWLLARATASSVKTQSIAVGPAIAVSGGLEDDRSPGRTSRFIRRTRIAYLPLR